MKGNCGRRAREATKASARDSLSTVFFFFFFKKKANSSVFVALYLKKKYFGISSLSHIFNQIAGFAKAVQCIVVVQ